MYRPARLASLMASLAIALLIAGLPNRAPADDSQGRDVPTAFSPFEYLVGRWNGQGVPKDNAAQRFRGWPESHAWAWVFTNGKPSGLSVAIEGGKVLAAGKLTYDSARKRYRLEGTESKPLGGPLAFEGALDSSGKLLILDQIGSEPTAAQHPGRLRLSLRPNSNFVRYSMWIDRKEPGAIQFKRSIEVGLTKEGETFAAGSTTAERPKCIVTGVAATMTLTYEGRTFSICCTGCRDEFNENPQKYINKARFLVESHAGKSKSDQSVTPRVNRFEDAFAGDVVDGPRGESQASQGNRSEAEASLKNAKGTSSSGSATVEAKAQSKSTGKKAVQKPAAPQPSTRATGLLQIGENLEKSGKTDAALSTFRRIVKDYPATPAAKTAARRIKALEAR